MGEHLSHHNLRQYAFRLKRAFFKWVWFPAVCESKPPVLSFTPHFKWKKTARHSALERLNLPDDTN